MNEYAAILGTLGGVLAGGMINYFATKRVKLQEWRLALARDELTRRQQLYAEYLAEAQRLTGEAIFRTLEIPKEVQVLDRLLAGIVLVSPETVIKQAHELRRHFLRTRSDDGEAEPRSFGELNQAFIAVARADLQSYRDDA